ncbi:MAG TPA: hypothetical protein VFT43_11665 [Candidatus Polarisedimenticolia bacterium]|nr:hypothetical protein [Candidatus Polarisedimenticolia bacterium]
MHNTAVPAALGLLLLTAGCANGDAALGVTVLPPPGSQVTFSRDIQPIFNASCAVSGCHAAPVASPMSLEPGQSYAELVGPQGTGVSSCEAPALKRVEPGNSMSSYLVLKITGTQGAALHDGSCAACGFGFGPVSDCGAPMPLFGQPLETPVIQLIRDWIDQGAKEN